MDILAYILAKNSSNQYTDTKFDSIAGGFTLKGSVNTYADLPSSASVGDEYIVVTGDDEHKSGAYVYTTEGWKPVGVNGRDGQPGRDGAIQYTAGEGIEITDDNIINATGGSSEWGNITGNIENQEDLIGKLTGLNNKINQRMALASGSDAKYQWDGDKTGRALIICDETPNPSSLAWVSSEITLSGKLFNSMYITRVTRDDKGHEVSEVKPGAELMENGTDFSNPETGELIGCIVGGDSKMIFISLPAGTYETMIGSKLVTLIVPQTGTYLMYDEGRDFYIYFSKVDDGSSTESYIEQNGDDITNEVAEIIKRYIQITTDNLIQGEEPIVLFGGSATELV